MTSRQQFWSSRCGPGTRRAILVGLVACFAGQTALVYLDPLPPGMSPLSEQATAGRRIWHAHNCQSCHQLYGFGGFLGPDLTNVTARLAPQRFARVLTDGTGRMPAFDLSGNEILAVTEFLRAMDSSGQGQAKIPLLAGADSGRRLIAAIQQEISDGDDEAIRNAFNIFVVRGCRGCHFAVGQPLRVAPDLLTVRHRLDRTELRDVLRRGRPPGMPTPPLSPQERSVMEQFIGWLGKHEYDVRQRGRPPVDDDAVASGLPWWEFR